MSDTGAENRRNLPKGGPGPAEEVALAEKNLEDLGKSRYHFQKANSRDKMWGAGVDQRGGRCPCSEVNLLLERESFF